MKNRPLGVGVLLLGIAAVGYVVLFWIEHPNRQRALDLKYEEMKQYEFEFGMMRVASVEVPLLLEKKSGVTYQFVLGSPGSPPIWQQLQYNQFIEGVAPFNFSGTWTLPFPIPRGHSPGAKVPPPLTTEELKKKIKSGQSLTLDEILKANQLEKQNKR